MIGANKIDWDEAQLSCNLWLFSKLDNFINALESKNLEDIEYLTDCIVDAIQERFDKMQAHDEAEEAAQERETEFLESVLGFTHEVKTIIYGLCDCNTWIKPREDN